MLASQQKECQDLLDLDPLNCELYCRLKKLSADLALYISTCSSWAIQRAKIRLLTRGEEDLKVLYSKIHNRQSFNRGALMGSTIGMNQNQEENITSIINHFKDLFNAPSPGNLNINIFPFGNTISSYDISGLLSIVTNEEIKEVVFSSFSTSSPSPVGFNFEFYKRLRA